LPGLNGGGAAAAVPPQSLKIVDMRQHIVTELIQFKGQLLQYKHTVSVMCFSFSFNIQNMTCRKVQFQYSTTEHLATLNYNKLTLTTVYCSSEWLCQGQMTSLNSTHFAIKKVWILH